jgi:hypothetical protein
VLPLGVLQSGGEHVLRHVVEVVGDTRRVVGLQRPVAAHLLERDPPEEQRIGGLALLPERRLDVRYVVLAAGGVEPALGRVDDAVERDVLGDDQVSHDSVLGWLSPARALSSGRGSSR